MMRHAKIIMAAVLMAIGMQAQAQSDDTGLWTSVGATKKFNKQWSANVEAEYRLQDNWSTTDRWTIGVSGAYKPLKWLKLDAGYKFIRLQKLEEGKARVTKYTSDGDPKNIKFRTSDAYWSSRHRIHFSVTGTVKVGDFDLSLRERWQYTYRPSATTKRSGIKYNYQDDEVETIANETDSIRGKGKHVLRSRLQVQYDKKRCPWQPYVSAEMYNGGGSFGIQKMRYTAGLEWKISKQHTLDVYYRYQRMKRQDNGASLMTYLTENGYSDYSFPFSNNDRSSHIVGVGYTFKF